MEIKKILKEDFDYETDSWDDGEVEQGKSFFEDGYDWKWMRRVGDVEHLDFDNWAVWMAFRPEDENNPQSRNVVAFFIVDEDTGFIDWGPCDTYEEAKEFLDSKVQDWENDEPNDFVVDESLNEDVNDDSIMKEVKDILDRNKRSTPIYSFEGSPKGNIKLPIIYMNKGKTGITIKAYFPNKQYSDSIYEETLKELETYASSLNNVSVKGSTDAWIQALHTNGFEIVVKISNGVEINRKRGPLSDKEKIDRQIATWETRLYNCISPERIDTFDRGYRHDYCKKLEADIISQINNPKVHFFIYPTCLEFRSRVRDQSPEEFQQMVDNIIRNNKQIEKLMNNPSVKKETSNNDFYNNIRLDYDINAIDYNPAEIEAEKQRLLKEYEHCKANLDKWLKIKDELNALDESLNEDFDDDLADITALADDCGENTFKVSSRDVRFTFTDDTAASKFMDELRDAKIVFSELPMDVISVNKADILDEAWEPTFSDQWKPEDIELWKSIDWKARNYRRYTVEDDTFEGEVIAYGLPGGEKKATVTFAKELPPNPIYEPVYKPTSNPFEGTVGFMYDGNKHDGYLVMDRTETQEVYDMLSESGEDEPYTKKQILDELKRETKNFTLEKDTIKYGFREEAFTAEEILGKHYESVELDKVGSWYQIDFKGPEKKNVEEDLNDPDEILTFKRDINLANNEDEIQLLIYELSDGAAEDIVQQAYDENESNDLETLKAAVIAAIDMYLEDDEWLGESKSTNEDFNKYRDEEGHLLADKWYASVYPDDEIGIEQLHGITLDDALKDRSILGHCDTQVRDRVYKQLDKYSPIITESRPDKEIKTTTNKVTIKYGNSVKEVETCKPLKVTQAQLNRYKDNYSIVDILDEPKSMNENNHSERKIYVVADDEDPDMEPYLWGNSESDISIDDRFDLSEEELWATGWTGAVQNIEDGPFESFDAIEIACHDDEKGEEYDLPEIPEHIKSEFLKAINNYISQNIDESKSINEGLFNDYIYLFPELTDDDIKMMAGYNIKYLGMNHGPDGSEDNWVVYGRKEDIEKYAENYLGYELHPDYLYEYDDFAGEIINESVRYPNGMEVRDDSVDMDKALDYQFGTDRDPDINSYTEDEKQRAINYWIEKTDGFSKQIIDEDHDYKYTMIEEYIGEELDKEDIIDWLSDHDQAYEDAQNFFKDNSLEEVSQEELVSWIEDHDQLYRDFVHYFYKEKSYDEDNLD